MTDTSKGLLPFGEHAEMRKAYEAEVAKWKGIVKGVHGALADLGDIPVPALDADLYDTVMSIRAKDAELIQMLVNDLGRAYCIDKPSLKLAAEMGFIPHP